MERSDYKLILGEKFEKQIFEHCYKYAMNNNLSLDWLNVCGIRQYYLVQCERIRCNLEQFPNLLEVDNIMNLSDAKMNPKYDIYNVKVTFIDRVYSKDHKCGRCGKKTIILSKIQLRAADEGHTNVQTCDKCGWSKREN